MDWKNIGKGGEASTEDFTHIEPELKEDQLPSERTWVRWVKVESHSGSGPCRDLHYKFKFGYGRRDSIINAAKIYNKWQQMSHWQKGKVLGENPEAIAPPPLSKSCLLQRVNQCTSLVEMEEWYLGWFPCDSYQCWLELWELWIMDGVRDQLSSSHFTSQSVDQRTQGQESPTLQATWVQFGALSWVALASAASRGQQKRTGPTVFPMRPLAVIGGRLVTLEKLSSMVAWPLARLVVG